MSQRTAAAGAPGGSQRLGERFATFDGVHMQRVSAVHLLPTSE